MLRIYTAVIAHLVIIALEYMEIWSYHKYELTYCTKHPEFIPFLRNLLEKKLSCVYTEGQRRRFSIGPESI